MVLVNNYYTDPGAQFNADNTSVRIDHKLSDNNYSVCSRGSHDTQSGREPRTAPPWLWRALETTIPAPA